MKKLKTNLTISIAYQLVAIIYGFVLPRLILEHFGSDVNGLTKSIAQFLGIISFLDMGVSQVIRSALYQPLIHQDTDTISRIMVSGRRFYKRIAYALVGYVVILTVVYPFFVDINFGKTYIAGLIAIMAVGSFMQYYFGITQEQLLHASQQTYLVYAVQILCNLFNLIVCIFLIRINCSIHTVKLVTAIIFLTKPIFYAVYVRRKFSINWDISCDEEPIAQKWNGIAQHISAVVLDGTDTIVLTFLSTLSNVSIYSVYYLVIGSIQTFYQSAAAAIQSAAGAVWAKQKWDDIRKMFFSVELGLHTATVFLFCCTGVLIVPFVQVYTNGLTDANYIQPTFAVILVLAYGIRCLRTPYNIWILASGHFRQSQRCHITAASLNLIISVLAVSCWGLVGVAIGTLIAMCYQTFWMAMYTTTKLIKRSISGILKQYLADFVEVALIYIFTSWITMYEISYLGWVIMAVEVAVIAAACIICTSILFYRHETMYQIQKLSEKIRI